MQCRLVQDKCVEVGDHVIVVAKVLGCGGYHAGHGTGLVYVKGGYRRVRAEKIDIEKERIEMERIVAEEQEQGFRRPALSLSGIKEGSGTEEGSGTASSTVKGEGWFRKIKMESGPVRKIWRG